MRFCQGVGKVWKSTEKRKKMKYKLDPVHVTSQSDSGFKTNKEAL